MWLTTKIKIIKTHEHHKQYLLATNLTIIEFFLFFNAFTTNKLSAIVACFTGFVGAVFALAVLSFVGFLHAAVAMTVLSGLL